MAQYLFEREMNDAMKMDAPLQTGPLPRWQRQAVEAGVRKLSLDVSGSLPGLVAGPKSVPAYTTAPPVGVPGGNNPHTNGTPLRSPQVERLAGGQKGAAARGGSASKGVTRAHSKTPSKGGVGLGGGWQLGVKTNKTPARHNHTPLADRYIPNRGGTDLEVASYCLLNMPPKMPSLSSAEGQDGAGQEGENDGGGAGPDYKRKMSEALGQPNQSQKILSFREKPPANKDGLSYGNSKSYCIAAQSASGAKLSKSTRNIPQHAERVLDAPGLIDDYYLNLLSWSSQNVVALSLAGTVYLWNATTGSITQLCEIEPSSSSSSVSTDEYISCVEWVKEGNVLAVSNSLGAVQIWDVNHEKLVRTMTGHSSRVATLSWYNHNLVSGSRSGAIHHHDVRIAAHHIASLRAHSQEVCGLQWSGDGRHIASGGNDNALCVWDTAHGGGGQITTPLHTFTQHQAAVKAIAWCPWQSGLLASGGGTADRHIRFWNVSSGTCLHSVDTNSQVCSIKWSTAYQELVSGHGFSQHQLAIWKYPSMVRTAELLGHTARILNLALSPDGVTVASAAADETLRFWKCFEIDKQRSKSGVKSSKDTAPSVLTRMLR